MKIPKKLKIGGHEIEVRRATTSRLAAFDLGIHEISISADGSFPESKLSEAFLHEIIEGIMVLNDLKCKDDHTEITTLSEALFAVIRNNDLDFRK
jgi:hypothetical protein